MTSTPASLLGTISALVLIVLAPACTQTAQANPAAEASSGAAAMPGDISRLTITLSGLAPQTGQVKLVLFADAAAYEAGQPVRGSNIEVTGPTARVSYDGLEPGDYAIKLYHDVNGNDEMDTNPFGMPTEPFAFSNNARGRFGPATWDKAAFGLVPGENTHAITVGG